MMLNCSKCGIVDMYKDVHWNHWYGYHGYWIDKKNHKIKLDSNEMYRLNHPIDLIQPDDPRFGKYYKKQAEKIALDKEQNEQNLKKKEEKEWKEEKELVEKFGKQAKDALEVLKERDL